MLFSKPKYYNIIIKQDGSRDIKLSLLEGKKIIEAIEEFNSHIQNKEEHIKELYIINNNKMISINLNYSLDRDIIVFRK